LLSLYARRVAVSIVFSVGARASLGGGKTDLIEERREAALSQVGGVERHSRIGGKDEPLISVAVSEDLQVP